MSATIPATQDDARLAPPPARVRSQAEKFNLWRVCAAGGLIFLIGQLLGWGYLGFNIPPYQPNLPIADLYAHYTAHSLRIRFGMTLSVIVCPFYFVWSAVISRIMAKIDGEDSPLAVIEQMGGEITCVIGLVGAVAWMAAAYHIEERTPEIVRAFHEFGWFFFDTTYWATTLQELALGWVFLSDQRQVPLVPRWVAWYSIFSAIAIIPLSLLPFFYQGPFAWSGLICYWASLGTWFVWVLVLSWSIFGAIGRLQHEAETGHVRAC